MVLPPAAPEDVTGLPPDVALPHAFLNSLDVRGYRVHGRTLTGGDAFTDPPALAEWLREHGLPADEIGPGTFERAVHLRAVLRESTRQVPGGTATLTEFPLVATAAAGEGVRLAAGGDAALTRILIGAIDLTARGLWARLKMCLAADCEWVFYDQSRPGKGRWCSPQLCGNRQKKRAYRDRRN